MYSLYVVSYNELYPANRDSFVAIIYCWV